ncbi:MAG: ABC transporter substrate-binding protein [Thaumarchaeota archaeon]|nr:ABC transporter substrate-binding protein [Nitrososphaerota archaeon]
MLFALGLGEQVVGVTQYCNYPPEAKTRHVVSKGVIDIYHMTAKEVDDKVQELARTGGSAYAFDTEWLNRVKPDLILTQDMCKSCDLDAKDVFCAIEKIEPKPQVLVLNPRRLSDIFANIRRVADAAGVPGRGASLVRDLEGRIEKVRKNVSGSVQRPRVLFLEWTDPPSPAGDWMPEQITESGGIPQLSESGVAPSRLNWPAIERCNPDVMIVGPCSHNISRSLKEMPNVARIDAWWRLRAVRSGNTYIVNSEYYDRPGPRIVDGIEILAQILHPDLDIREMPPNAVVKLEHAGAIPPRAEEVADLFHPYDRQADRRRILERNVE